jgi:hypothetical protein
MAAQIDIAVNPDRRTLSLTVNSKTGASRSVSLSADEVGELLQNLGEARMNMEPPRQPKPGPRDKFQGTMNSPVQIFPGTQAGSILLLLLDIRYGLLGFEFHSEKWNALVKQVSDFLEGSNSRN